MPALPTAKWQLLRSLGVTRDGRAVEGLLASGEALTRGGLLGAISFRRPGVLCLRVSESEGETPLFRCFRGSERRPRKTPKGLLLSAIGKAARRPCVLCARLGPQTHPRAGVRMERGAR